MKFSSALLSLSALVVLPASASEPHGDPLLPVGTLDVDRSWVRTGERPKLTWNITYPQYIENLADITVQDTLIPRVRTTVEIRVVGAAYQEGATHTPLSLQARIGSTSGWEQLFLGADNTVDPSEVLYSRTIEAGTTIDFSSRAQSASETWHPSRDTLAVNHTVMALRNGDPVPYYVPAYEQGEISSFLTQYVDSNNRITIGPRDVIYLYELYATDTSSSAFDMQDMVVLVTLKEPTQDA